VLQQQNADGLVICPSVGTTAEDIEAIVKTGTPVTIICRDVEGATVPSVRGDDVSGMYQITRHLIDKGHRRIAFLGGIRHTSSGRDRHGGFMKAMNEAGLTPVDDIPELMNQGDGRRAADRIAQLPEPPTAVVCFNDVIAFGLMSGFAKLGIKAGSEIAVTGYDDVDGSESWAPALTTVKNGSEQIGREAARAIHAMIVTGEAPFEHVLIAPQIELRDSSN